jgi:hypothetical protein
MLRAGRRKQLGVSGFGLWACKFRVAAPKIETRFSLFGVFNYGQTTAVFSAKPAFPSQR